MLRGLLRPKWILIHVGVAALVVLMVNLAFWQLRRLDEKRTFNRTVISRSEMPVEEIDRATGADSRPQDFHPDTHEWRRVTVRGTYHFEKAVRVVNRSQDGTAGWDQVVPLLTEKHGWVIVNRGFIPLSRTFSGTLPPDPVTVMGYLRVTQTRGTLGAVDSTDITNKDFQRFDIPLMARQLDGPVFPMYLQLLEESPSTITGWPAPVSFPELSEGPHKSYAFQWFFFSLVALAAWAVVIRRKWRGDSAVTPPTPARTSA